jgi:hypothetical protein
VVSFTGPTGGTGATGNTGSTGPTGSGSTNLTGEFLTDPGVFPAGGALTPINFTLPLTKLFLLSPQIMFTPPNLFTFTEFGVYSVSLVFEVSIEASVIPATDLIIGIFNGVVLQPTSAQMTYSLLQDDIALIVFNDLLLIAPGEQINFMGASSTLTVTMNIVGAQGRLIIVRMR